MATQHFAFQRQRRHLPRRRILAGACSIALALTAAAAQAQVSDLDRLAIEVVAARTGVAPDALAIENTGAGRYELQGQSFFDYKISERGTGALYAVALSTGGAELDLDSLNAREQELYVARYGHVSRRLADTVAQSAPDERLPVILWAQPPHDVGLARPAPESRPSETQIDAILADLDKRRAAIAKEATHHLVSRLEAEGLRATADPLSPAIAVSIAAKDVRRISDWHGVLSAYSDDTYESQLATSGNTIGAYPVHAGGNTGQGINVAEIEVGGRADSANPYLSFVYQDPNGSCYNNHGTLVGGVIRSTHPTHRGISPAVDLWIGGSCFGSASQLMSASSRAATPTPFIASFAGGARTYNLSFGGNSGGVLGGFERYYDDLVQNGWRTVVVAAGNAGNTGRVLSPAIAYNVVAVGAFNDNAPPPWPMAGFSSGVDPISQVGDREKPEVAAPGVQIMAPSGPNSAHVGFLSLAPGVNGTSFAAPMVAAASALMMRTNSALQVWPESVKAILMASATNNIEGATRLSELDGAGGINAQRANGIAGFSGGTWGGIGYSCASPTQWVVSNVFVTAGRRVRVAMAWDANPYSANTTYANRPGADLDMQVLRPGNIVVASSLSWDNTYEIVDFVAPVSGTYQLRVHKFSCSHTPKWLGWAWALI